MKKKITLPNVTLLAATSVDIDLTNLNLKISSENIEFAAVKLLSSSLPNKKFPNIKYISIPQMNFSDYNRLIIEDLHKYFNTSHCLIVQSDSFVVNYERWTEEFLKFDYIGAPWPDKVMIRPINKFLYLNNNRVGNGGFSLRSRKLVEVTSRINFNSLKFSIKSEDLIICHYLYREMIKKGIRFAPPKLAAQFSIESPGNLYRQDVNSVFGFHGKHLRNYYYKKYTLRSLMNE
jgi:hypothetical protein|tara:strand:+ start:61 stop:759 length:699 start_codon:yes stop_codon:yes gene_type:complete